MLIYFLPTFANEVFYNIFKNFYYFDGYQSLSFKKGLLNMKKIDIFLHPSEKEGGRYMRKNKIYMTFYFKGKKKKWKNKINIKYKCKWKGIIIL